MLVTSKFTPLFLLDFNFTVRRDSVKKGSSCNATIVWASQMPSVLLLKWKDSVQEIYLPIVS